MRKFLLFIAIFFICLTIIRVGLGVSDELKSEVILNYLADQEYGTTHLKETISRFSKICKEIELNGFIDSDGNYIGGDLTFVESVETSLAQLGRVAKLVGNAFLFLIQIVELFLVELIYLLKIVFYLLFGVPL